MSSAHVDVDDQPTAEIKPQSEHQADSVVSSVTTANPDDEPQSGYKCPDTPAVQPATPHHIQDSAAIHATNFGPGPSHSPAADLVRTVTDPAVQALPDHVSGSDLEAAHILMALGRCSIEVRR